MSWTKNGDFFLNSIAALKHLLKIRNLNWAGNFSNKGCDTLHPTTFKHGDNKFY